MSQHPPLPQHALRSHIQETTLQKFLTQGIRNVKMDDIAMEAGISKRTLYEMFGDKENLLLECLRQHARNSEMEYRRITNRAKNPIEVYVYVMERRGKVLQGISSTFITEALKYESVRLFFEADKAENHARAREFFIDGIEKGYFRSDVNLDVLFTFGEIMGQFVIEKQLFESYPVLEVVETLSDTIFRGLCTQKGIDAMKDALRLISRDCGRSRE